MKKFLSLFDLGRVLRLTATNAGAVGVEVVEAASLDAPTIQPYALDGTTDSDLRIFGLGTGRVYVNGQDVRAMHASGSLHAPGFTPDTPSSAGTTKYLREDATWAVPPGAGDARVANPLSQFAATTSAQLASVISDETGSGLLVFGTSPTLVTPVVDYIYGASAGKVAQFLDAASTVNYFVVQSRAAGQTPRITATGSDTDVSLALATKGAGTLKFFPGGSSGRDVMTVGASGENQSVVGKITFPSGSTNAPAIPDHTNATHTHTNAAGGGTLDGSAIASGTIATARLSTGTTSSDVCVGNDSRLSDPRTPTAHATSHKNGGSDEIATTTAAAGAIPKAGSDAKLGSTWIPQGAFQDYAHPGTTNYEAWFAANCVSHTAFAANTALTANRLYAIPFVASHRAGCALDRVAINVTTGSSGNVRLGIYTDSSGYPDALLLDCGTGSTTSTGVVSKTIAQALTPGGLYWLVAVFDATPTIRTIPVNSCSHALGFDNTLGTAGNCGLYVSFSYAALPGTFPGSPTMITANPIPALFYRYSS